MNKKITAIKIQKNNPRRVNIYLDDEYAFGLNKIVAAWLQKGQELDDEIIHTLLDKDAQETVYQRVLKFIGFRERSTKEIELYLKKNGVSEDIIQETIEHLKKSDLINDQRFAELWVENRTSIHPKSQRMIRYELNKYGISPTVIERVLARVDEENNLILVATKRANKYENLEWHDFRDKLFRYLLNRGFAAGLINDVIQNVWRDIKVRSSEKIITER